jgi:hypothetical protein
MPRVYLRFALDVKVGVWRCEFLNEGMTTPMARRTFGTADKVRELAERGGALHNLESRQMLEYGISSKRGGLMLKLTTQQYQKLVNPVPPGAGLHHK